MHARKLLPYLHAARSSTFVRLFAKRCRVCPCQIFSNCFQNTIRTRRVKSDTKAIKVEVKIPIVERTTKKRVDDDDGFFRQQDDKFQFAGRISVSALRNVSRVARIEFTLRATGPSVEKEYLVETRQREEKRRKEKRNRHAYLIASRYKRG